MNEAAIVRLAWMSALLAGALAPASAMERRAIDAATLIATGHSVRAERDDLFVLERTAPHATAGAVLHERDEMRRIASCVFERRHVRRVEQDGRLRVVGTRFERYDFTKFRVSRNLGGFVILEGRIGLICLADGRGRADPMAVFADGAELDCDNSIELQSLATGERYDAGRAFEAVSRLRAENCFPGY